MIHHHHHDVTPRLASYILLLGFGDLGTHLPKSHNFTTAQHSSQRFHNQQIHLYNIVVVIVHCSSKDITFTRIGLPAYKYFTMSQTTSDSAMCQIQTAQSMACHRQLSPSTRNFIERPVICREM